jgi:hypothetical protein
MVEKKNIIKKEIKKQTWKYFIQQKILEIIGIPIIAYMVYKIGGSFRLIFGDNGYSKEELVFFDFFSGFLICLGIGFFVKINWEWAKHRANDKIKKNKGK